MSVLIEKKGRRIEIRSPEPLPGLRTTVPGAYQTVSGYWTVPLSIESCKLLREKYGDRLEMGNELRRWATGVVENRKSMARLAAASNAKLHVVPRVAPRLYKAMKVRRYQRVGAKFVAENTGSLIADDPGLGKTLIAMAGILEAEVAGPYLVVAPKTASDTVWRREIRRWLPTDHRAIIMPQHRYQRDRRIRLTRYTDKTWLIVHPEMLQVAAWWVCGEMTYEDAAPSSYDPPFPTGPCGVKTRMGSKQQTELNCGHIRSRKLTEELFETNYPKLFDIQWGAIIVDESHDSLIRRKGVPTQRRRGLDMIKASLRGDGMLLAMSGTPFNSKPHHLWGTLNWLDPVMYSAFHRWSELYWHKGGYTGYEIGEFRQDREAMLWDSLSAVALRRTKAEVAPDLPPKMEMGTPLDPFVEDSPVGVWLEMHGPQAKAYHEMEEDSIAQLESGDLSAIYGLEILTRLKQFACSTGDIEQRKVWLEDEETGERYQGMKDFYVPRLPSNKFDWTVEALEEWGYPSNPITRVVIVSQMTGLLNMFRAGIEQHFKTKLDRPLCTAITGHTKAHHRRGIIDRFNSAGGPDIMLLNVKAGGTAITLDTADRMIFISETRIPDQQLQAEDRIHRVSNPRQCMYYYLRSLGTVDVGTALINAEMKRATHRLLDGRRGIEYMRRVMALSK